MGQLLYGRDIAARINHDIKETVSEIQSTFGITPKLALLTVDKGDTLKRSELLLHENAARHLGIEVHTVVLNEDATDAELLRAIRDENEDPDVHGILILLPLPPQIDQDLVFQAIAPDKEIEGLSGDDDDEPIDLDNLDDLPEKQSSMIAAVRMLLEFIDHNIPRSRNVFVTEAEIPDNPLVAKLLQMSSQVSVPVAVVTTKDPNVRAVTRNADLVLVSVLSPEIVDDTFLKKGAVVIDFVPVMVGEKYSETKGRLVPILKGGVNVTAALRKASFVAPGVGGIGPIGVATMMRNLVVNCRNIALLGAGRAECSSGR